MPDSFEEKAALARMRDDMARSRTHMSHELALQRQSHREAKQLQRREAMLEGNLEQIELKHQIDPEIRDRDFADLVREENVRIQSLGAELALKWQYNKAEKQLDHNQAMEALQGEILRLTVQTKMDIKKMAKEEELEEKLLRFKAELAQEFGQLSEDQINDMVERLVEQGKLTL